MPDPMCHPDCGPITAIADGLHAHDNSDGRCWHENEDVPEGFVLEYWLLRGQS